MKSVSFLTEAGRDFGLGHLTRCVALADAFQEAGYNCRFCINGDGTAADICKNHTFRFTDWYSDYFMIPADLSAAALVVIDSYHARRETYQLIRHSAKQVLYFDDNLRIHYPPGIIINGALGAPDLDYPDRPNTHYLLGPRYQPLRKSFWDHPKKPLRAGIKQLIVLMGGSDPRNLTPDIVQLLNENFPDLHKEVIVSKSYSNLAQIFELADRTTKITINPSEADLSDIYMHADLGISAGGQTLFELARFNIPSVTIGVAENQYQNLMTWQKSGFTDFAGWWKDPSLFENLLYFMNKNLTDREMFRKKRSMGSKIIDGKGARRIVRKVSELGVSTA